MWRQCQQPQPQPNPAQPNQNNNIGVIRRDYLTETIDAAGGSGFIINVTMTASTGHKVVIKASGETTIENLLKMYILSPDSIGKDVMFLFNGAQLDPKSQEKLGSKFRVTAAITVYDLKGIIGA